MLAHHQTSICLSFLSKDLLVCSTLEALGTLYQKDQQRFHLVFTETNAPVSIANSLPDQTKDILQPFNGDHRLLWLDISPFRVIMTTQDQAKTGYRHFWERGVYGRSRFWLQDLEDNRDYAFELRNYTRYLNMEGYPLLSSLRLEYELWSSHFKLGEYILHLEISH